MVVKLGPLMNAYESRLQGAVMRVLRSIAGYSRLDRKMYEYIRHELAVRSLNDLVREYRQKWFDDVERIHLLLFFILLFRTYYR